ncbi:unnamed protein product [Caenorhabditis auriculariae]|uniref:Uncharacterized protein n=1 Tax=Caenorhabditis auriculariae TaxID=2777116 RepID=A0A8S1H7F5_9PELO|nr:unnamed protein product [Caenorhabditis auriculariae]
MDVSDLKRKEKSREEAIRMDYDGKLQEILEKEEKSKESRTAANHGDLAAMRDEMSRLEERLLTANRDKTAAIVERNAKIDAAAIANVELRQQVAELNAKLDAVNGELSIFKSHESQKEAEVTELHRKISSLMTEKIDLEADHRRKERSWEVRMGQKLYQKIEKLNEEKEAQISNIKMERDRLECSVAELKKKLEVTPETVAEAQKLRNQLQNSEKRQREAKEKYHSALGEMQAALRMVEKQQKNTQIKIQQSILSNSVVVLVDWYSCEKNPSVVLNVL